MSAHPSTDPVSRPPIAIALSLCLCLAASGWAQHVELETDDGLTVHEFGFIWETGVSDDEVTVQDLLGELPSHVRTEREETPLERRGNNDGGFPNPDISVPVSVDVPAIPSFAMGDPLLFFYSHDPVTVDVSVEFTEGRPIAWFPKVDEYRMQKLTWSDVNIHPRKPKHRNMKIFRDEGKTKWKGLSAARKIPETCYVECGTQVEKYLFYEAAVSYPTALLYSEIRSEEGKRSRGFKLKNTRDFAFQDIFIFPDARDPRQQVAYLAELQPDETVEVWFAESTGEEGDSRILWIENALQPDGPLHEYVAGCAEAEGLFGPEAELCARTVLDASFMRSTGRKAIYRLPAEVYNEIYPLSISPVPGNVVRVGMVLVPDLRNRSVEHFIDVAARGRPTERGRARGALVAVAEDSLPVLEEIAPRARGKAAKYLRRALDEVRSSGSDR